MIIQGIRKTIKKVKHHIKFRNTTYDEALDLVNDSLMKGIHKTNPVHTKIDAKIVKQQKKQMDKTLRKIDRLGRR